MILIATSGSRSSIEATVFAAELAAGCHAVLRIVQVLAPIEYRVGRLAPMRAVERKLADPFESPVLRAARELAWRHGAAASLQLLSGDPPQAIVAAASRAHADVLVIGARSPGRGLGRKSAYPQLDPGSRTVPGPNPGLRDQAAWSWLLGRVVDHQRSELAR